MTWQALDNTWWGWGLEERLSDNDVWLAHEEGELPGIGIDELDDYEGRKDAFFTLQPHQIDELIAGLEKLKQRLSTHPTDAAESEAE